MTAELRVEDVAVHFADSLGKSFAALKTSKISFPTGTITTISGPSGSGKSTLLHLLAGLLTPQAGQVIWKNEVISGLSEFQRDRWRLRNIGYIFQDFQLLAELSPVANVSLPASFGRYKLPADRAVELLKSFGVPHLRKRTSELSRGEQQRVAFARAMLFDPPIILADEPTASLDEASADLVLDHLAQLAKHGKTIVVASHDAKVIAAGQQLLRLDHGEIKQVHAP